MTTQMTRTAIFMYLNKETTMHAFQKVRIPVFLISLSIGIICMVFAYYFLSSFTPVLDLQLIPEKNRLALRFTNTGTENIALDTLGMEFFIYYPQDDSNNYLVIVQNKGQGTMHEKALRESAMTILRPGEHVDVGDIYPMLKGLPAGIGELSAVYSTQFESGSTNAWQGTVKSLPIPVGVY